MTIEYLYQGKEIMIMNNKTYLKELFECLDEVLNDYWTTYDPVEDRESVIANVSTQKIVALHEAYNRCKEQAYEMNHTFLPMDSAPMDGTKVILMQFPIQYPVIASFENDKSGIGWCTDFGQDYVSDDEFCGWFPIPKIMENK